MSTVLSLHPQDWLCWERLAGIVFVILSSQRVSIFLDAWMQRKLMETLSFGLNQARKLNLNKVHMETDCIAIVGDVNDSNVSRASCRHSGFRGLKVLGGDPCKARWRVTYRLVTFWIADPPAVSFYTFHCSKPPISDSEDADLEVQPHVVGAEGRFVLIRTSFASGDGEYEFFIYKGDPRIKELLNPCPGVLTIAPDKAMLLRDGVLVWVDLLRGMLVCDILQEREPLRARYIPLPEPLPRNREEILKQLIPGAGVRRIRDVAYVDGLIKFVEMEHRVTVTEIVEVPPEKPSDPRDKTVLYDSDLIMLYKRKHVDNIPKTLRTMNGWSAMTWTREIGSDCWLKGVIVDVDDILVDDSAFSALLSGQRNESAGSLTFKNMYSACSILSTDGNDILYLKLSRKWSDRSGWVVAVDLEENTLKVEAPGAHPFGRYSPSWQTFLPCALVNHLKMTPGNCSSALVINMLVTLSVLRTIWLALKSQQFKPHRQAALRMSQIMQLLLAEKANHAQDLAQSTVRNVHSSQACPDQNNMTKINTMGHFQPPQPCFNRWEAPGYRGYSSCPPQNNPPLPQCFNKFTGPCNPVCAPSAPAPNIRSYDNYHSLWQHPLLPEQQMAPSRAFGPHVAPHPYFNNWRGARHHGNSQQHPASNSYYYGAHSGSGNQGFGFGYRPIYYDYRY
ncbi:hypothetical protein TRIUR3_24786 [Triticum urartu]|uniref:Uncharacterized protein n=1 Tax=Triticum urartu TaxID=4572 RepID=M7YYZ4_TRIUA|nr:hypothetical protein TRIUR3_24786 [Triticum urartu]